VAVEIALLDVVVGALEQLVAGSGAAVTSGAISSCAKSKTSCKRTSASSAGVKRSRTTRKAIET